MVTTQRITPFLWFADHAEEAARFYTGIFENSRSGGDPKAQQCGWLKDRYGLSWQIVPNFMDELFTDAQSAGAQRAMEAMLRMKKLDIAALRQAYAGTAA